MGFTLFKFLHILTMFLAVSSAAVPEVVLHRVAASNDVPAIRVVSRIATALGKMLPLFFVGGAIFGLLAAFTGELNFLAPWLIAAYIVFIIAMVTGATITGPWAGAMSMAAEASSSEAPSAELLAVVHDRRALMGSVILMSAIVVIIFLMVVKPGA